MSNPLISVIMAVYNDQDYIEEAIDSVLQQSVSDFEFIIFDDGSTDDSITILQSYAQSDKRISLHLNRQNIGLTKNLNKAIDLAKGEFIARMDADDVCMPSRFERQLTFLRSSPHLLVCGSWTKNIDEKGNEISVSQGPTDSTELNWLAIFRPPFAHPTAIFRTTCFSDTKVKYDENYRTAQDFEMWSRLHKIGDLAQIPEYLVKYRTHTNNVSTKRKTEQNTNAAKVCFRNVKHYFPEFVRDNGELLVKQVCHFMYGFDGAPPISVSTFINLTFQLQNSYIDKISLTAKQSSQIKKLTVRWIIQGVFVKNAISNKQKLIAVIKLLPYLNILKNEMFDFIQRRRSKNL